MGPTINDKISWDTLPENGFLTFYQLKLVFPHPLVSMQCCAAVPATCREQQTPQLWMEGRGEGCGQQFFFSTLKKGVPSVKVTDIKIMWLTFFQDQILCPLNGGIPWIEVPNRRYSMHCNIYYFVQIQVIFEKEEVTAMKTFGDPGMIHCNSLFHRWLNCINTKKYYNLIGSCR